MNLNKLQWRKMKCSRKQLRLDITLKCGQSFRWKVVEKDSEKLYIGVLKKKLHVLKQDDEHLYYSSHNDVKDEELFEDYFNMKVNLETLYEQWSKVDPIFLEISTSYPGVRMLRQDPIENLFSFICSANNNIQRISSMVENMCKEYGEKVAELDGEPYYSFPSLEALSQKGVEEKLRALGFGYRAKYIEESAKKIIDKGGEQWLLSLRKLEYKEAKDELLTLSGIGPKVADCILLMSLDQPSSVPVDTHVFQIAKQYLPHLNNTKTVTTKIYAEIGDHFRGLYGEYAGWAHSVLFSADLRHLQSLKQPKEECGRSPKNSEGIKSKSGKKPEKAEKPKEVNKRKTNKSKKEQTKRTKTN